MSSRDKISNSRISELVIIAAIAKSNVIGDKGRIPWHLKEDLTRFKRLTMGWPVIMGMKTFESLPIKPLPGRVNIIVTRKNDFSCPGFVVKGSLDDAIEYCGKYEKIFVIGGQNIYEQALARADRLELTMIDKEYPGDAFFPQIDRSEWELTHREERNGFSFESYVRKR